MGILLGFMTVVKGQVNIKAKTEDEDSLYRLEKGQKDVIDILSKSFNLNKNPLPDTTKHKGLGPYVSILPGMAYALVSGYTVALASNVSFYTDRNKYKISSVLASAYYSLNQQYWAIINSNIFSKKLKLYFTGNWRFYKFPTFTYGLGSQSPISNADQIDYNAIRFYQTALREIVTNVFIGIGYQLDYHWNVKELNNTDELTDFQKYGKTFESNSSGISLNFIYDNRTNSIKPDGGEYGRVQYRQNYTFLGSDRNWQSIMVDVRKYLKFPYNSNNVLAFWSYNNLTLSGTPPYLDLPSNGWDDYSNTGRGYVQGRFRGKGMLYFESEYRFSVTRNGLLGGVIFQNFESLSEWPSNTFKSVNPGEGIGIRIKINKFSGINIAVDYGFGKNGSRGLFFNLGEIF